MLVFCFTIPYEFWTRTASPSGAAVSCPSCSCSRSIMMHDLSQALVYLHNRNIVHRDVKPENLLCEMAPRSHMVKFGPGKKMNYKLADFGLAVKVDPSGKKPLMTVCGTPTYVAPEILAEIGYGLEVDNWAAGVICYILLCGFPPFRNKPQTDSGERLNSDQQQEELFSQIQKADYEFLAPYWDMVSEEAKDLVKRLLIVNKKSRRSAAAILQHKFLVQYTKGKK